VFRKLLVIVVLLLPGFSQAQISLSGQVLDADNKQTIASANVYLSNSSVGTITNEKGQFIIQNFPSGRYELVISCIGYTTQVIMISSAQLPPSLTVLLKPNVKELQEVIVEPYEKNGWDKWGSFFMENFIGTIPFAKDCKLLNKELIKFRFSKKNNILQAFANDRLVIENKALGYTLKYDLISFDYDFNTRMFLYQGYPLFEEMETKREGVRKKWMVHREEAYYGSMLHFMRSLYRNKLSENHFEVRKLIKLSSDEKKRVKAAYLKARVPISMNTKNVIVTDDKSSGLDPDTLAYYRKVMQDPESLNILINQILPGDSIAYAMDSVVAGLAFSNYLQIVYTPKKTPPEYVQAMHKLIEGPITSEIFRVSNAPIAVFANGSYFEGTNLISSGYWAWSEKIAALLPTDYWPRPLKK
jgi:hypothetical protein